MKVLRGIVSINFSRFYETLNLQMLLCDICQSMSISNPMDVIDAIFIERFYKNIVRLEVS